MRFVSLLCLFFLFSSSLFGQDIKPCATPPVKSEWLKKYQQNPDAYPKSDDILYVPMTIHIVGTDAGTGYFTWRRLIDAFCTLNTDFEASQIQLYIEGEVNYIDNSDFYIHDWNDGRRMMDENNVANTINVYFVEDPAGACGYSNYSRGIAMRKSCSDANDHTWAHEIGHYLSLPHPFFGWEGYEHSYSEPAPSFIEGEPVELLDGSNCAVAGDGFCDTRADYINYRWQCNSNAESSLQIIDPTGEEFRADGSLFMSYANDECSSRFSDGQIAAMRANLLDERTNLLYDQSVPVDLTAIDFDLVTPPDGVTTSAYDQVYFEWEPIEGIDYYLLQISRVPNFTVVYFEYNTTAPFFTSTDLSSDKKYYWRVQPFSRYDGCTVYSESFDFVTGLSTQVKDVEGLLDFQVQPNPSISGTELQIQFSLAKAQDLQIHVYNGQGQVLQQQNIEAIGGNNQFRVPTDQIPAGLYFVGLVGPEGKRLEKVIIR